MPANAEREMTLGLTIEPELKGVFENFFDR